MSIQKSLFVWTHQGKEALQRASFILNFERKVLKMKIENVTGQALDHVRFGACAL
jgi:hypothetical protein